MANQFEYSIRDDLKALWEITDDHISGFVAAIHSRLLENPTKITVWLDTDACVSSSSLRKMAEGLSRVMTIRDFEKKIIEFKRRYDYSIPQEMNMYLDGFKNLMIGPNTTPFIKANEAYQQTERHREVAYQRHQRQIASQIKEAINAGRFDVSYTLYDDTICEVLVEELRDNGYNVEAITQYGNSLVTINWNV